MSHRHKHGVVWEFPTRFLQAPNWAYQSAKAPIAIATSTTITKRGRFHTFPQIGHGELLHEVGVCHNPPKWGTQTVANTWHQQHFCGATMGLPQRAKRTNIVGGCRQGHTQWGATKGQQFWAKGGKSDNRRDCPPNAIFRNTTVVSRGSRSVFPTTTGLGERHKRAQK